MIRKILMGIITCLLAVLVYFSLSKGISIGGFQAWGLSEIKEENKNLDSKISNASKLTSSDYPSKESQLNESAKKLLSKKEEYADLTTYSSEDQVKAANELQEYEVEYLWATVGNYATKEGIKIKMQISTAASGEKTEDGRKIYDLNFTAEGSYIGIALFLADIQDDSFLEFKIENFNMTTGDSEESLKATFVVKDIPIKIENLSTEMPSSQSDTTNANNTINNTAGNTTGNTVSSNTNGNTTNVNNTSR